MLIASTRFDAEDLMVLSDFDLPGNELVRSMLSFWCDMNHVLEKLNESYDTTVAILEEKDWAKLEARLESWREDFKKKKLSPYDLGLEFLAGNGRRAFSEEVSHRLSGLFLPAVGMMVKADQRLHMRFEMLRTAGALLDYREKNGDYPVNLTALVPDYLDALPEDIYADSKPPVRYRKTPDGFRVYSVGENQLDEFGLQQEDNLSRTNKKSCELDDFVLIHGQEPMKLSKKERKKLVQGNQQLKEQQ